MPNATVRAPRRRFIERLFTADKGPGAPPALWIQWLARHLFGAGCRIKLYTRLSGLLGNQVPLDDALEFLYKRGYARAPSDTFTVGLYLILAGYRQGGGFAEALRRFAPASEIMLLEGGEKQNTLDQSMRLCVQLIKDSRRMRTAVISAISGALIMLALSVITFLAMADYIIPEIARIVNPRDFKGVAYQMYVVSNSVNTWQFDAVLALFMLLLVFIPWSLPRWTGRVRLIVDQGPPYSFYRVLQGGAWLLSLSAMLRTGYTVQESLKSMLRVASPYLRERLQAFRNELNKGLQPGSALDSCGYRFPDQEVIENLVAYEDLPNFDELLANVGFEYVADGVTRIEAQAAILKSALTIIFGLSVLWIALGTVEIQNQMQAILMSGAH